MRTEFGAEDTKIIIDKKQIRVWKIAIDRVESTSRNNKDIKGELKVYKEWHDKKTKERGGYFYKNPDVY